jgi:hypothetical protein
MQLRNLNPGSSANEIWENPYTTQSMKYDNIIRMEKTIKVWSGKRIWLYSERLTLRSGYNMVRMKEPREAGFTRRTTEENVQKDVSGGSMEEGRRN